MGYKSTEHTLKNTIALTLRALLAASLFVLIAMVPTSAHADCGDGVLDGNELCDDGNILDGDCCDANCGYESNGSACADDGNQCTADICDGEGTCTHSPQQGTCSDGNPCTIADFCTRDGVCANDGILEDGTNCTQLGLCGLLGVCNSGVCEGEPENCNGFGDVCNAATCNPQLGQCELSQQPDGTVCDNPSVCTDPGQCQSGECIQPPVDCSGLENSCHDAYCDVEFQGCVAVAKENGSPCDDNDACTDRGICDDGKCLTTPIDCSDFGTDCSVGACNPQTGDCEPESLPDATSCDDDDPCTQSDQCTSGACGGDPLDCSSFSDACHVGACSRTFAGCGAEELPDGASCDDGDSCTNGDQCQSGSCTSQPVDCTQLDGDCTTGACNPETGNCEPETLPDATSCDDGNPCTQSDQCAIGSCGGAPLDCSSLSDECHVGACNVETGNCEPEILPDGTTCNDDAFCTASDTCQSGACSGTGNPCASGDSVCNQACNENSDACAAPQGVPCESDGNPCTENQCDGNGSCEGIANSNPCDDGLFCTTNDHCDDGVCIGEPTCPATEACSATCNEAEDACLTCGKPFSSARCVVNAVFVLQSAVGLRICDLCTCDVNSSGSVTSTDALMILQTCTGLPTALQCPLPSESTTTTTPFSSTTTTIVLSM